MALEIMNLPGTDIMAPVVFCDHCGVQIIIGEPANVEYLWAFKEQRTPYLKFVHKACSHEFRRLHPDYPLDKLMWMWVDFADWLNQLSFNTQGPTE